MKYKTPKIEELFEAGAHYGHQVKKWHPKMSKYIYTAKDSVHIIDLEQTEKLIVKAAEFLHDVAKKGDQIIFVGTKRQARGIIEDNAKKCGALWVNERWLGGTMTNYKTIKKNVDKLLTHIRKREAGEYSKYTKKERLLIDREVEKLQKIVGGLTNLNGIPAAVVVVDPRKEKTAVNESNKMHVPVVSLVDTNSDPSGVDYIIPCNDDAIKSLSLIVGSLADAIEDGYKEFEKDKEKIKADKAAADKKLKDEAEEIRPIIVKGVEVTEEVADKVIKEAVKKEKPLEKDAEEAIS